MPIHGIFASSMQQGGGSSLLTNILGYWNLDEITGTVINDQVGTLHGTSSALINQTGKIGKAIDFNGSTEYCTLPNGAQPTATSQAFSFWFNEDAVVGTATSGLICLRTADDYSKTRLAIDQYRKLDCYVDDGVSQKGLYYNSALTLDAWYHVVLNIPGNGIAADLWLNGSKVASSAVLQAAPGHWDGLIALGDLSPTGSYRPLNGLLDEIGIWNRSLTDTEIIDTLWNSGNGRTHPFN